jgi:hypothetical protein
MINEIYLILKLVCFCWVFTNFEPIHNIFNLLTLLPGKVYQKIYELLTCTKCFAFWFALAWMYFTGNNLFLAFIVCVCATFLNNNLTNTKLKR